MEIKNKFINNKKSVTISLCKRYFNARVTTKIQRIIFNILVSLIRNIQNTHYLTNILIVTTSLSKKRFYFNVKKTFF